MRSGLRSTSLRASSTASILIRSPNKIIFTVRSIILRSSTNDIFWTYQISRIHLSVSEITRPPFTCAQPVMPGRTDKRAA